jgi:hypothetical protein
VATDQGFNLAERLPAIDMQFSSFFNGVASGDNLDDEQGGAEPHRGEDTTDESEGEVAHYTSRRREILDSTVTVFADASEEYGSLPALKARLESWKASHGGEWRSCVCHVFPSCGHMHTCRISAAYVPPSCQP